MYYIVYFSEENLVEGVPKSWVSKINDETYCKWPPKGSGKLIKKFAPPAPGWKLHPCTIKGVS